MDLASAIIRVVVTDANIIINLLHINSLGLLGIMPGYEFVVPDEVVREVTEPGQRQALQNTIDSGVLRTITVEDIAALKLFGELSVVMGPGEAACLSLAQTRGWLIASDERKVFRREAVARLGSGRIINAAGILVRAIRVGLIDVDEADRMKAVLEKHRFRMRFASFRELF